jgi:hypothetical protein
MGLIGFLFWRSPASLTFGVAPGLAILALAVLSLKVWRSGKSSLLFILAQAGSFVFCNIPSWQVLLEQGLEFGCRLIFSGSH